MVALCVASGARRRPASEIAPKAAAFWRGVEPTRAPQPVLKFCCPHAGVLGSEVSLGGALERPRELLFPVLFGPISYKTTRQGLFGAAVCGLYWLFERGGWACVRGYELILENGWWPVMDMGVMWM